MYGNAFLCDQPCIFVSKISALDMGLTVGETQDTIGVAAFNPFSLEFSAAATLSFVDFLHAQQVVLIG